MKDTNTDAGSMAYSKQHQEKMFRMELGAIGNLFGVDLVCVAMGLSFGFINIRQFQ